MTAEPAGDGLGTFPIAPAPPRLDTVPMLGPGTFTTISEAGDVHP
jgi:hypothetical protein